MRIVAATLGGVKPLYAQVVCQCSSLIRATGPFASQAETLPTLASASGCVSQWRHSTVKLLVEHLNRLGSPSLGVMVWSMTNRYSPAVDPGS